MATSCGLPNIIIIIQSILLQEVIVGVATFGRSALDRRSVDQPGHVLISILQALPYESTTFTA